MPNIEIIGTLLKFFKYLLEDTWDFGGVRSTYYIHYK